MADFYTKTMFYISNRPKEKPVSLQEVPPGIHVLSNANLDSPWPKVGCLRPGELICSSWNRYIKQQLFFENTSFCDIFLISRKVF